MDLREEENGKTGPRAALLGPTVAGRGGWWEGLGGSLAALTKPAC